MQEKLMILREKNNYSKKYMAEKLGISAQQYSNKEKGKFEFSSDEMFILRNLFNKPLEDIFLPRNHQNGDKGNETSPKKEEVK
jgi:putative transcriptional regulator